MIDTVEFTCGSCEAPNRIKTQRLLRLTRSPRCGNCNNKLLRAMDDNFDSLDPACYQHPLDQEALEKLKNIPGIQTLLRRVIRWTLELNLRLSQAANTVQVSEQQLPSVYARFKLAAARLGMQTLPELYVVQNTALNASTFGVEQYFVTVTTGALEMLDEDEQVALFAHELGHIHSDHMLYKTAARLVSTLAAQLAAVSFGLGGLIALPLRLALLWWDRCAELTADRAALLAVRNPEVVLRLLLKTAGGTKTLYPDMNFDAFLEQADRLDNMQAQSGWSKTLVFAQELFRSHPFPVYRAKEIVEWITSGNYLEILDGDMQKCEVEERVACPHCHRLLEANAIVCPGCGKDPEAAPDLDLGDDDTLDADIPTEDGHAAQANDADNDNDNDNDNAASAASELEAIFGDAVQAGKGAVREASSIFRGAVSEASDWWRKNAAPPSSGRSTNKNKNKNKNKKEPHHDDDAS